MARKDTKNRLDTSALRRFRYRLSKTKLRVPILWIRHRNFRPADVFLGAYPRSGSTWLRFTLFEALTGQESGFDAVNSSFRGVGHHDKAVAVLPGGGRLLGTHESYRSEYKRAIYLVRDARDVALSEYAFQRALGRFEGEFSAFLHAFLHGRVNGYGAWPQHVCSWLDSRELGPKNLLLIRFEDMRSSTEQTLARILDFLGTNVDANLLRAAISNNSLEKMRQKEKASPQRVSLRDRFVRSGSVGGWRGKLTEDEVWLVQQHAGHVLFRLGYPGGTFLAEQKFQDLNATAVGLCTRTK